jgi:hypothetical protein
LDGHSGSTFCITIQQGLEFLPLLVGTGPGQYCIHSHQCLDGTYIGTLGCIVRSGGRCGSRMHPSTTIDILNDSQRVPIKSIMLKSVVAMMTGIIGGRDGSCSNSCRSSRTTTSTVTREWSRIYVTRKTSLYGIFLRIVYMLIW